MASDERRVRIVHSTAVYEDLKAATRTGIGWVVVMLVVTGAVVTSPIWGSALLVAQAYSLLHTAGFSDSDIRGWANLSIYLTAAVAGGLGIAIFDHSSGSRLSRSLRIVVSMSIVTLIGAGAFNRFAHSVASGSWQVRPIDWAEPAGALVISTVVCGSVVGVNRLWGKLGDVRLFVMWYATFLVLWAFLWVLS